MNSATAAMVDGIKDACEAWGRAVRWILQSRGEGYPTMATFERAREGELSANDIVTVRQHFGEVMLGDALAVSRAVRGEPPFVQAMPERLHRLIFLQYVVPRRDARRHKITIDMKASEMGIENRKDYYVLLENAHHYLLARIPVGYQPSVPRGTKCNDTVPTLVCV